MQPEIKRIKENRNLGRIMHKLHLESLLITSDANATFFNLVHLKTKLGFVQWKRDIVAGIESSYM